MLIESQPCFPSWSQLMAGSRKAELLVKVTYQTFLWCWHSTDHGAFGHSRQIFLKYEYVLDDGRGGTKEQVLQQSCDLQFILSPSKSQILKILLGGIDLSEIMNDFWKQILPLPLRFLPTFTVALQTGSYGKKVSLNSDHTHTRWRHQYSPVSAKLPVLRKYITLDLKL